jgi:formate hydrogenlyase subunit 4
LPIGMATDAAQPLPDLFGALAWLGKIAAGGIALAVAETSVAKMRVFRLPNYLGAALMLGLLGVLLLFVSRGM